MDEIVEDNLVREVGATLKANGTFDQDQFNRRKCFITNNVEDADDAEQEAALNETTASYDMGWQKRGTW